MCFGCNEGGDISDFLQKHKGVSLNEAEEAVKDWVNEKLTSWDETKERVDKVFPNVNKEGDKKEFKTITLAAYQKKLVGALKASQEAQAWLREQRGIGLDTAVALNLGFAQDIGGLDRTASRQGLNHASLHRRGQGCPAQVPVDGREGFSAPEGLAGHTLQPSVD